jgi:hypothetical protein
MPLDDPGQLIYLSAASLAQRIREKKVSAQEAVKAYLARIARVNPQLNAVAQLCAERAQREAKSGRCPVRQGKNGSGANRSERTIRGEVFRTPTFVYSLSVRVIVDRRRRDSLFAPEPLCRTRSVATTTPWSFGALSIGESQ